MKSIDDIGKLAAGDMKRSGAAPDPVERPVVIHVLKTAVLNSQTRVRPRQPHHLRARVEGGDLVAKRLEVEGISTRATARVENGSPSRDVRQERAPEITHVDGDRSLEELLGELAVVGFGAQNWAEPAGAGAQRWIL